MNPSSLRISLVSLLNEISLDQVKQSYVGPELSAKDFDKIFNDITNKKLAYTQWLAKNIAKTKFIKAEDIDRFKSFFDVFEKKKKKFPKADINQYKTEADIQDFITTAQTEREKDVQVTGGGSGEGLATSNEVDKLASVGIELLGLVDGYQVFKVPQSASGKGSRKVWKTYKDVLGRCAGRDQGAKIDICTMASSKYFNQYLKDGPYYVIFNLNDKQSPYQFHYESDQFMDKNDQRIA
jgi:hypothetical protein